MPYLLSDQLESDLTLKRRHKTLGVFGFQLAGMKPSVLIFMTRNFKDNYSITICLYGKEIQVICTYFKIPLIKVTQVIFKRHEFVTIQDFFSFL